MRALFLYFTCRFPAGASAELRLRLARTARSSCAARHHKKTDSFSLSCPQPLRRVSAVSLREPRQSFGCASRAPLVVLARQGHHKKNGQLFAVLPATVTPGICRFPAGASAELRLRLARTARSSCAARSPQKNGQLFAVLPATVTPGICRFPAGASAELRLRLARTARSSCAARSPQKNGQLFAVRFVVTLPGIEPGIEP